MRRRRESLSDARATDRRRGGFTLVELLVVLVVLGLAAAVVVPMIGNTGDLDTAAAARKLTADVQYAQNYAITHQTRVQVSFNAASNTYTLAELPVVGSAVVLTDPVTKKPYVVSFGPGDGLERVDMTSATFAGATTVVFDSLGAPDQGGTVVVTSGGVTRNVSVAPVTGKISVQ